MRNAHKTELCQCGARKPSGNRTCGHDPCKEADEAARLAARRPLLPMPGVHPSSGGRIAKRFGADGEEIPRE